MNVTDITLLSPASASPVPAQTPFNQDGAGMAFRKNSGQDSMLKRYSNFVKRRLIILR